MRLTGLVGSIFGILTLLLMACSSTKTDSKKNANGGKPLDQKEQNLTEEYAGLRSRWVSNVAYSLNVFLDKENDEFKAQSQIEFTLSEIPKNLHLDFRGGRIAQYSVNNKDIENPKHVDGMLSIPSEFLKLGDNHVVVHYAQKYSRDGRGLYRFKDQEDGRVYLWTQFESFDANQFMPCFDQPDLKATLRMTVTAPQDWEVISTTLTQRIQRQGNSNVWYFLETPKMSTYLFSLHAGPYKVWASKAGAIPLRLFARQSLAQYVHPDFWFKITQQGLNFFGSYFDYPYPFKKYDQVIAPDFNGGAMENIAAITFSERFIRRGQETRSNRENLANVILHEMAHQWFGDLVTMKWWNGLWLNESFATYMAYLALANATEFKDAWMSFQNGDKSWAYEEDQRITTHPINGKVPDIESTFTNFDGITYGKGAAVLKQLAFYLGETNFRNGLRQYFKQYQYKNTSIEDFIGALEQASKKNLNEWAAQWLEKKGLDSAELVMNCADDHGTEKITSASIKLTGPENELSSRVHATQIGLYDLKNAKLVQRKLFSIEYSGPNTNIKDMVGEKCPDFAYLNAEDHDYVKTIMDPRSLAFAKSNISNIQDPMMRQIVWNDMFEMVRDRKISISEYVSILLNDLPKEKDVKITNKALEHLWSTVYYLPKATDQEKKWRSETIAKLELLCLSQFTRASAGSDQQKTWFDALVSITESPETLAKLTDILNGKMKVSGFVLDQDRRWNVVVRLNTFATKESADLLAKERAKDKTENGVRAALAAEVSRPDGEKKFSLIGEAIAKDSALSFSRKRVITRNAFPINQDDFRKQYSKDFYTNLLQMIKQSRDSQFLRMYTNLTPTTCDENSLNQITSFLDRNASVMVPSVMKPLKISKQEEERCIAIRRIGLKDSPVVK